MNKKQLKQLREHIAKSGGATLNKNGAIMAFNSGYCVSVKGYEKSVKKLTKRIINKYLKIAGSRGMYAGVWLEDGLYCLDISENIATREQAIYAGVKNEQRAIYDCFNNDYIYLK